MKRVRRPVTLRSDTVLRAFYHLFYNIRSIMTIDGLDSAFLTYKFPEWIQTRLPEPKEKKIDDILTDGWEPFYLRHFKIGLQFSIVGLIKELCT